MKGNCRFYGGRREADEGVAGLIRQRCPYGIRARSHAGCKVEAHGDNDCPLVNLQRDLGEIQLPLNGFRKVDHDTVDFPGALDLQRSADEIRVGGDRRIDVPAIANDKEEQHATFLTRAYWIGRDFHADAEHGGRIDAGGRSGAEQGESECCEGQVVLPIRAREVQGVRDPP
jgi:hypothetical protein